VGGSLVALPALSSTNQPSRVRLFAVMARDANLTLGGGSTTAEVLRRSLTKRGWITNDTHRDLFAVSRLTPGTNLLAYCTAIGWHVRGIDGAIVALVASSVPSALACVLAYLAFERLNASPIFSNVVLLGMTAAALLLGSSAWHLAKPALNQRPRTRAFLAAGMTSAGISPALVLLACGIGGAAWTRQ
jgi:chromate transporter